MAMHDALFCSSAPVICSKGLSIFLDAYPFVNPTARLEPLSICFDLMQPTMLCMSCQRYAWHRSKRSSA